MRRALFNLAAAVSLVLTVVCVWLAVKERGDLVSWTPYGVRTFRAYSSDGVLLLIYYSRWPGTVAPTSYHNSLNPGFLLPVGKGLLFSLEPFGFEDRELSDGDKAWREIRLSFPYWVPISAFVLLPLL